ncbi:hypothetical protein D3C80_1570340 [compost metagenome]
MLMIQQVQHEIISHFTKSDHAKFHNFIILSQYVYLYTTSFNFILLPHIYSVNYDELDFCRAKILFHM